jgi:biopolymer transport protein ExbD
MSLGALPPSADEDGELISEINITPLTDVFLVLLIIFMVTTTVMSQSGMEVELPRTESGSGSSAPEGVILTLLQDGAFRVNEVRVEPGRFDLLEAELKRALEATSQKQLVLEGDRRALLGDAVKVLDLARRAGARGIGIATEQEK